LPPYAFAGCSGIVVHVIFGIIPATSIESLETLSHWIDAVAKPTPRRLSFMAPERLDRIDQADNRL
jgi:hypothetical protein